MSKYQYYTKEQAQKVPLWLILEQSEIVTFKHFERMFKDVSTDENMCEYNGDFIAFLNDCVRWDDIRPVYAVTMVDITTENNIKVPAIVDYFISFEQAERDCEEWGWFYDDCFTACKSLPLYIDDLTSPLYPLEWYTKEENRYTAEEYQRYLYK